MLAVKRGGEDLKWVDRLKKMAVREKSNQDAEHPPNSSKVEAEHLSSDHERLRSLTPREREVFTLLVQGKKMREAAEILGVKQTTISFHSTALYKKLDVHDRAQLILRYGLARSEANAPSDGQ